MTQTLASKLQKTAQRAQKRLTEERSAEEKRRDNEINKRAKGAGRKEALRLVPKMLKQCLKEAREAARSSKFEADIYVFYHDNISTTLATEKRVRDSKQLIAKTAALEVVKLLKREKVEAEVDYGHYTNDDSGNDYHYVSINMKWGNQDG